MTNLSNFRLHRCSAIFALLACATLSYPAIADSQQEWLLFTSIDAFENFSDPVPGVDDSFIRPTLDIVYSYSGNNFRFLGEYIWSNSENELERMKVGWQASDKTMLWLGRFHTPSKLWTTEYHHGQYLQNSITRPSIEEWEDDSGPLPSHATGLLLEHQSALADEAAINFAFSAGLGPIFEGEELVPFDLLDPNSGHGGSYSFRMSYMPDVLSLSEFGVLAGSSDINVDSESNPDLADLNDIQQLTLGLFGNVTFGKLRLIANFVYVQNDLHYVGGDIDDEFVSGYLQGEYEVSNDWTLIARTDNSFDEETSPYLQLLPAFISHRHMLGVRWDFLAFQSFTVELARTSILGDESGDTYFSEGRIQWSAVFP